MIKRNWVFVLVWTLVCSWGWSGGPMIVNSDGIPLRWGGNPPVVKIYPDSGGLGPIGPEAARAALLYSADQWSAVPSASIVLQDAGFVESATGPEGPGDFTAQN
ncbi:MAG: hypothetical protein P8020_01765, partial [Acidobacteriota bacterium]